VSTGTKRKPTAKKAVEVEPTAEVVAEPIEVEAETSLSPEVLTSPLSEDSQDEQSEPTAEQSDVAVDEALATIAPKPVFPPMNCAECLQPIYEGENKWAELVDPNKSIWNIYHHDCKEIPADRILPKDWKEGHTRVEAGDLRDGSIDVEGIDS